MIIGNGLIAKAFLSYKDNENIVIFASGVSNSVNPTEDDFKREQELLEDTISNYGNKIIVYFSSCDIVNPQMNQKIYYKHKVNMENIIKKNVNKFYIFRLPQVIGEIGNKHTLINFFIASITNGSTFKLYSDVYKSLIDYQDVYSMCNYIISNNLYLSQVSNILNPHYMNIQKIVKELENFLNKKAIYTIEIFESKPQYDKKLSETISLKLDIDFNKKYFISILEKYYLKVNHAKK